MNIVLCGMPGSGKTTVGALLAITAGGRLVDTDGVIVERYGRIADIFAERGEGYFRELEASLVKELSEEDGLVIATGGGLVLREENVTALKKKGRLVFLRAGLDTLVERLKADTERPLLQGGHLKERLQGMLEARAPVYERVADITVDVDGKTPEEIVKTIGAGMR